MNVLERLFLAAAAFSLPASGPAWSQGKAGWSQATWPTVLTSVAFEEPYAWVGTDAGLVRIDLRDGTSVTYHSGNSGLGNNHVLTVAVGPSGEKWIGTQAGLAFHKPGMWDFYDYANSPLRRSFGSERIPFVAVDRTGQVWAGADMLEGTNVPDGGLFFRFDGSTWTRIFARRIYDRVRLQAIAAGRDTLWLGVESIGPPKGWSYKYLIMPVPLDAEMLPAQFEGPYSLTNGGEATTLHGVFPDNPGSFWSHFQGWNEKPLVMHGRQWNIPHALPDPGEGSGQEPGAYILSLDTASVLWAWTAGRLYRHGEAGWTRMPLEDTLARIREVREMKFDPAGRMVWRTDSALYWLSGNVWRSWDLKGKVPPWERVRSLAVDASGRKWVGTSNGLFREDAGGWTWFHPGNSGLPHLDMGPMHFDREGTLWALVRPPDSTLVVPVSYLPFRGFPTLVSFDGSAWKTHGTLEGLPEGVQFTALAGDLEGNLWVSSRTGLFRRRREVWTRTLADLELHGLAVDAGGRLWAGGPVPYPVENGLPGVRGKVYRLDAEGTAVAAEKLITSILDCPTIVAAGDGSVFFAAPMYVGRGYARMWSMDTALEGLGHQPGVGTEFQVMHMASDRSGGVWAVLRHRDGPASGGWNDLSLYGHRRGVFRWLNGSWTEYTPKNSGLQDADIHAIAAGPDGTIWFATANGLSSLASEPVAIRKGQPRHAGRLNFDGSRFLWVVERPGEIRIEILGMDGRFSGIALQGRMAPGRYPLDVGPGPGPRILRVTGAGYSRPAYVRVPGMGRPTP